MFPRSLSLKGQNIGYSVIQWTANVSQAESQKKCQRVSVANRKIFARPESFCEVDI